MDWSWAACSVSSLYNVSGQNCSQGSWIARVQWYLTYASNISSSASRRACILNKHISYRLGAILSFELRHSTIFQSVSAWGVNAIILALTSSIRIWSVPLTCTITKTHEPDFARARSYTICCMCDSAGMRSAVKQLMTDLTHHSGQTLSCYP